MPTYTALSPSTFRNQQETDYENKKLIPLDAWGLQAMSIGFWLKQSPMIWRGPMVMSAIEQMIGCIMVRFRCTVIDLPPGTGDAQHYLSD